jgi:diacylglycerol diphosphate phosphatase / phosphatidate phosphatase
MRRVIIEFLGMPLKVLFVELFGRCVLLGALFSTLFFSPFDPYIPADIAYKYSYPFSFKNSVPFSILIIITCIAVIIVPLIICLCFGTFVRRNIDVTNYVLGLSLTLLTTCLLIEILKIAISRPRPDFLQRCFGSSSVDLTSWSPYPKCTETSPEYDLKDGLKAFPSGHSALAWTVAMFLFLYIYEKKKFIEENNVFISTIPSIIVFLCGLILSLGAAYITSSRLKDHRHHPEDVIAGTTIGCLVAIVSFYMYYPVPSEKLIKHLQPDHVYDGYLDQSSDLSHLLNNKGIVT